MESKKPHAKDKTPHDEAPVDSNRAAAPAAEPVRTVEAIQAEHAQAQLVLATLKAQMPRDAEAVSAQKQVVQALAAELAAKETT